MTKIRAGIILIILLALAAPVWAQNDFQPVDYHIELHADSILRERPADISSTISVAPKGTQFHVSGEQGDWLQVEYEGQLVWLMASIDHTRLPEPAWAQDIFQSVDYDILLREIGTLRQQADIASTAQWIFLPGAQFHVSGEQGDWLQVEHVGQLAWLLASTDHTKITAHPDENLSIAMRYTEHIRPCTVDDWIDYQESVERIPRHDFQFLAAYTRTLTTTTLPELIRLSDTERADLITHLFTLYSHTRCWSTGPTCLPRIRRHVPSLRRPHLPLPGTAHFLGLHTRHSRRIVLERRSNCPNRLE